MNDLQLNDRIYNYSRKNDRKGIAFALDHEKKGTKSLLQQLRKDSIQATTIFESLSQQSRPDQLIQALLRSPDIYELPWKVACKAVYFIQTSKDRYFVRSVVSDIQLFLQEQVTRWIDYERRGHMDDSSSARSLQSNSRADPADAMLLTDSVASSTATPRYYFKTLFQTIMTVIIDNDSVREDHWVSLFDIVTSIVALSRNIEYDLHRELLNTYCSLDLLPVSVLPWFNAINEIRIFMSNEHWKGVHDKVSLVFAANSCPKADLPGIAHTIMSITKSKYGDFDSWRSLILRLLKAAETDTSTYSTIESVLLASFSGIPCLHLRKWIIDLANTSEDDLAHSKVNLLLLVARSSRESGSELVYEMIAQSLTTKKKDFDIASLCRQEILTQLTSSILEALTECDCRMEYLNGGNFRGDEALSRIGRFVYHSIFFSEDNSSSVYNYLERAQSWIDLALDLLDANKISSLAFAVAKASFVVVFCEIKLARGAVNRRLCTYLMESNSFGQRNGFDAHVRAIFEAFFRHTNVKSLSKKELEPLLSLLQADISLPIIDCLALHLRESPAGMKALWSIVQSTFDLSTATMTQTLTSQTLHESSFVRPVRALNALLTFDGDNEYVKKALALVSDYIVLSRPILPLSCRRYFLRSTIESCMKDDHSPLTLTVLFASIMLRTLRFLKVENGGNSFDVAESLVLWTQMKSNSTKCVEVEDTELLISAMLHLFDSMRRQGSLSEIDLKCFADFRSRLSNQIRANVHDSNEMQIEETFGAYQSELLSSFHAIIEPAFRLISGRKGTLSRQYYSSPGDLRRLVIKLLKPHFEGHGAAIPLCIRLSSSVSKQDEDTRGRVPRNIRLRIEEEVSRILIWWLSSFGTDADLLLSDSISLHRNRFGHFSKGAADSGRFLDECLEEVIPSLIGRIHRSLVDRSPINVVNKYVWTAIELSECMGYDGSDDSRRYSTTDLSSPANKRLKYLLLFHRSLCSQSCYEALQEYFKNVDGFGLTFIDKKIASRDAIDEVFRVMRHPIVKSLARIISLCSPAQDREVSTEIIRGLSYFIEVVRDTLDGECGGITEDLLVLYLSYLSESSSKLREANLSNSLTASDWTLQSSKHLVGMLRKYSLPSTLFKSIGMIALSDLPRLSLFSLRQGLSLDFGQILREISWREATMARILEQCLLAIRKPGECKDDASPFLRFETEKAPEWSLSVLLRAIENDWIESQGSLTNSFSVVDESPYLELRRATLHSGLCLLAKVFPDVVDPKKAVLAMNIPNGVKVALSSASDCVASELLHSAKVISRGVKELDSQGASFTKSNSSLVQSLACVMAWLTFPSTKVDISVWTRLWMTVEEAKHGQTGDAGITDAGSNESLLRKLSRTKQRLDETREILEKALAFKGRERDGMESKRKSLEALDKMLSSGGVKGDLVQLFRAKSESIEGQIASLVGAEKSDEIAKKRKAAPIIEKHLRKDRKRVNIRSRNAVVDEWLRKDGDLADEGEADAFVDLEDFIVDG